MGYIHQAVFILLCASCGYACARGGPPERMVAVLFLGGALASMALGPPKSGAFNTLEPGIVGVDTCMFLLLCCLALYSSRFWPLAMAGLQGAEVLGHLARLVEHPVLPHAYFALTVMWSFPMLALLGLATWRHRRRLDHYGRDFTWSWELPAALSEKELRS